MGFRSMLGRLLYDSISEYREAAERTEELQTKATTHARVMHELSSAAPHAIILRISNGFLVRGFHDGLTISGASKGRFMYCETEEEIGKLLVADKVRQKIVGETQQQYETKIGVGGVGVASQVTTGLTVAPSKQVIW